MPDIYDLNTSCFIGNWPLGGTLTINNYTNSQGTNTQSSITEISNFNDLASTPLLFLYGGESTPIPVQIAGGEVGTTVEIANFSDLETITQPVSYGGGTNPVPVEVTNELFTGSVIEIFNQEYELGTITSKTQRIVLAYPTQDTTGSVLATPYNALSISGAAATFTNLIEIDLLGLDCDLLGIALTVVTHVSTPPGASTSVTVLGWWHYASGLTSGQLSGNSSNFSAICLLTNSANATCATSGMGIQVLPFRYLYLMVSYSTMAAAVALTCKIHKGQLINLYS